MSNYYRDRYNEFIANASDIFAYLNESYMDALENRVLDQGEDCISLGRMQFIRVLRYRKTDSVETDFEAVSSAMRANLRYCSNIGAAFGYFIVSLNGEIGIYLAVEEASTGRFVSNMTASIPDVNCSNGFISQRELSALASYAGVMNGNISCRAGAVDKILSALFDIEGIISILAYPMEQYEVYRYVSALSNLKRISEDLMSDDAEQNRRVNRRSYSYVPEIDGLLKNMIEYYDSQSEQFWKYCLWFGSRDRASAQTLGASITSAFNGSNAEDLGKLRCFYTVTNPLKEGRISIPTADYSNCTYAFEESAYKPSLLSYISTSDLSTLIQLPTVSFNGFEVVDLERQKSSVRLFDPSYMRGGVDRISLGADSEARTPYSIEINDISQHVLITGATGSGKTNTVMEIAQDICDAGIPLLIVEPSKKDYWKMSPDIRGMKIYSFGQDAEQLLMNPLMPEEGIIIANHVDSLLHAFSGAFEMEPPTRFALDGLMKYTYEAFNWRMNEVAYHGGRKFPRLNDMLALLPEYVKSHLPYGDEVKNNIYGSLINRLSSLTSGMIGESFDTDQSVTGEELCSGTVLVELDDLSLETKPFTAMLLMIKVEQYLRQSNASDRLRNVIVLEEAHNIFANVSNAFDNNTKKQASDSFSNMLSQIREYGTGIIIADQGASQINDTAVANTKIKIIHSVVDGNDIDKVAFALNLTDIQKRVFPSLATGEAIVSVRGNRTVSRVRINRKECTPVNNIACVLCPNRRRCDSFNEPLKQPVSRMGMYSQEIFKCRFNPERLKSTVNSIANHIGWPVERQLCLLGHLLSDDSIRCGDREKRRIIRTYQSETEG